MNNMEKWVSDLIANPVKPPMPVLTYPGLQLTGKKVIDLVTNAEDQSSCIEVIAKKFPTAAGLMVMDLSVEAEAFGSKIAFEENEIPTIKERLVYDAKTIEELNVPIMGSGRTSEYVRAAKIATQKVTNKPIFGGMIGPYSLAGRLFDITEIMTFVLTEPGSANVLIDKCTRFLIEYAKTYKDAGAGGVVIAEPAAGLLPADMCDEFSSKYVKRIVEAVQDETFLVILHNCGNTVELVPTMLSTGAAAFHFGNAVKMTDILPQIPENILAFGNLDPVSVFKTGSPEQVYLTTKNLLNSTKAFSNFIISSGCDIPPGSPLKNLDAFFNANTDFYK